MKLTHGNFIQKEDWNDWLESKYLQLNQYNEQGMFGNPVAASEGDAIFHLVWTYNIKAVDGRKKARCVCDGSTRSGQVLVLAKTYANCVDQTSTRLFYAVAAAENILILVQMSLMHLPRPLHQSNLSSYDRTRPSTNGELITSNMT
jgi:hypothetical protein